MVFAKEETYNYCMHFISVIYRTILESLFPYSQAEKELFSYTPEDAYRVLPPAPKYTDWIPNSFSIFRYKDERVAKMIWNIKYKKSKQAVRIAGYALYQQLQKTKVNTLNEQTNTIIIPIPITAKRRKERGYNQVELLVDEVYLLDKEKLFSIRKDILVRSIHTERQTLKNRYERLQYGQDIFSINNNLLKSMPDQELNKLKKMQLIVVDDVITTGSTIKEAMNALRNSGFNNIRVISVAH